MLLAAGGLGACSPSQTPEDFGTVPEAMAAVRPAVAPAPTSTGIRSGRRTSPSGASSGASDGGSSGARRRVTTHRATRTTPVKVPAGKIAPVVVSLPGHQGASVVPEDVSRGELTIPASVGTLGWWIGGVGLEGGTAGSMVIAGHVDSASQGLGYLAKLREVAAGERITVTGSDGSRRNYYVTGRRTYAKDRCLPEIIFSQSVQARLVLITCTGRFDSATGRYEDNLVVYAVPGS